ncbi:transcriptional regulator, AbrB family [Desulfonatronospira thiodismutans ASO3-1]|uniref:Transcriptional regulator, AbrB family n=1 Tax=Desulfonatronospira thiodismutans ASO3-1 TaxID=555779 RepID=D6SUX5_9BACT|nr:AbrB/MazE/SpoVT family DNA-binding domain-containing protein [Desulfonatronospira thiodismutans]EFI32731.1 transcriptional regulator, AbrB family [Desulfonatronospira thiodismutans ASO3-1]
MLVKVTSKNQITIPKKYADKLQGTKYLDVQYHDGALLLKPVQTYEADLETIRSKMEKLGLGAETVQDAINWSRSR